MEKIINTSALIDRLKILLWDCSKSREELAELAVGLIEEAGEEIVRGKDCKWAGPNEASDDLVDCRNFGGCAMYHHDFCADGERRDSDG